MSKIDYKYIYNEIYKMGYQNKHARKNKSLSFDIIPKIVDKYNFKTILDVGCATGRFVERFRELGKRAYGIDISSYAIKMANNEFNLPWCKQGDILNIPYEDNKFSAVYTTDTLEHIHPNDIKLAISELKRVSKRYLFIHVSDKPEANRRWIKVWHKWIKVMKEYDNLHLTILSQNEWIDIICDITGTKYIESIENHTMIFQKGE